MKVELVFCGASRMVTGSSYLLKVEGRQILIDCGMFQGGAEVESLNDEDFLFNPKDIEAVVLTHAHIDHCGLLPKLVKKGFKGTIYCTAPTREICEILLPDSAYIQSEQLTWMNRKRQRAGLEALLPLYTLEDVEATIPLFQSVLYDRVQEITPHISFRFVDAGHILGSASVEMEISGKKIVFSGDIGNQGTAILRDPVYLSAADVVVMESTYGDHLHRSRQETIEEFRSIIQNAFEKGGNIVIPAFAVERTQEILYEIGRLYDEGNFPEIPVYVDSPLAINATEIFRKHPECYDEATWEILKQGRNPLDLPLLRLTRSVAESRDINRQKRAVIISASGMAHAGRILHHLKHNLWKPETHVIFVGYQAHGTLGREILDGAKSVKIMGEEIAVKAHIHSLGGFSAHADQAGLLKWVGPFESNPQKVFLAHGEYEKMQVLAGKMQEKLGIKPEMPELGQSVVFEW